MEARCNTKKTAKRLEKMKARHDALARSKTVDEESKKKEIAESLAKLKAMPVPMKVLVKIFNCLPNHDVRCGISLACKTFHKICQNESLVPVKDLCIYGRILGRCRVPDLRKWANNYNIRNIEAIKDIIIQSKNLNFLKIKSLNTKATSKLVSIALKACPKLRHLEIVEPTDGEYCM